MIRTLCASLALCATLTAQPVPFATRVVSFDTMGQAGGGIFNTQNLLGAPNGRVHSLGIGGNAVLGFDVTIADGPGCDLIVGENPFTVSQFNTTFAEMVFVEVSSDGVNFARIPNAYYGPPMSPGAFGIVDIGMYEGLAGATPINMLANDPRDVCEAGGDAIDLADLRGHPMVTGGTVDLMAIREVRLVDVRNGVDMDSRGNVIYDPGGGSADVDHVTVIHDAAGLDPRGPVVDVVVPADGAFEITYGDPDGWRDLDPATLLVGLWGVPVSIAALLPAMTVKSANRQGVTLKLIGALPPGMMLRVSASVKDRAGNRSGDVRSRPVR